MNVFTVNVRVSAILDANVDAEGARFSNLGLEAIAVTHQSSRSATSSAGCSPARWCELKQRSGSERACMMTVA